MNKTIHVVPHQHFDIIWRRDVKWYREKRVELIMQALNLLRANSDFTFTFSQAAVIREFLAIHPECFDDIKMLLKTKRLEMVGGVETVSDLNMSSGAAILKNIEMGKKWFHDVLDYDVVVGGFEDAFGISAQLPQLLKLGGYRFYKAGRMPRVGQNDICGNFILKGLDGTGVHCVSPEAGCCDWGWGYSDNPDDPTVFSMQERCDNVYRKLKDVAHHDAEHCLYVVMGEEHDILPAIIDLLPQLSTETGCDYTFSTYEKYYDTISESEWDNSRVVDLQKCDLSRIFTGCYTTRHKSKLEPYLLENQLFAAEMNTNQQQEALQESWRDLFVLQFHDAICGCHIDENASYLQQLCKEASQRLEVSNVTLPWQCEMPDYLISGGIAKGNDEMIEFNGYSICFRDGKLSNIQRDGQSISKLCNLCLYEDSGTLWTEEYSGKTYEFSGDEQVISVTETDNVLQLVTEGQAPGFREMWAGFSSLSWRKTMTFRKSSPIVKIDIDINWLGNSTEIALAWSSNAVSECIAGIPFGSQKRTMYTPTKDTIWGDAFPALNWVKVDDFAVINQATPGHAIRKEQLQTILLRSPVKRWSPWFPVTPTEQCWDNGAHHFSFLWLPKDVEKGNARLQRLAMEFGLPETMTKGFDRRFENVPENIVISSVMKGDEFTDLIAYESEGRGCCWNTSGKREDFKPYEIRKIRLRNE